MTLTLNPQINPATSRMEIAVIDSDGRTHLGAKDNYRDADALRAEILARRELAHQERAALVAEARPTKTARRRKTPKPCECPQCQPQADADGAYWCKAGKEFVGYHAGLYITSGPRFLQVDDALNRYHHTLLVRPLPDATAEEVADVLAAA